MAFFASWAVVASSPSASTYLATVPVTNGGAIEVPAFLEYISGVPVRELEQLMHHSRLELLD